MTDRVQIFFWLEWVPWRGVSQVGDSQNHANETDWLSEDISYETSLFILDVDSLIKNKKNPTISPNIKYYHIFKNTTANKKLHIFRLLLGLCKLGNEILKEAKNAEKSHF